MSFPKPFFRWRPHPWHGLSPGPDVPRIVHGFIEITPADPVKYEVDKETGYLRVDRPQKTNSLPPCLYGFIPQTYCGDRIAKLSPGSDKGDGDPLDICVLSERPILRSEVLLDARVVGVFRMIDKGEADDKIIAILKNDAVWGDLTDVEQLPKVLVDRIQHYFQTYKLEPGGSNPVPALVLEGAASAFAVIEAARLDYDEAFGGS